MALIELNIPAGFRDVGTDLESEGRWLDGNLVRWREGSLRPVGGWSERINAAYTYAPRGMIAWEDNSGNRWIGAGTYEKLYVSTAGGVTSDITPAGFTTGAEDASVNTGYGGGFYGLGYYGTPRPDTGNFSECTTWSLDTYGQYLVGCSMDDGKLYEWQLDTGTPAAAISNAPTDCVGLVTTEERIIFALGAGGDPRKVQWCDFEDNTTWTAASTNQAGDVTLQTPGRIQAGVRMQGQTLILTDQDAFRAIYTGPPFVYEFERVGSACGVVSRLGMADTPAGVFWMGQQGFFVYDGSRVNEVPCDVWDRVFTDRNTAQVSKIWAVPNGQNGEVWFFYPSKASNEIDKYVAYNYREGHWTVGDLDRTSGVDRGIFRTPIWADDAGNVYDHETGYSYDGATVYAETGPLKIGAGDNLAVATRLIPDELTQGDATATFKTRYFPNGDETTHGPYSLANPTSVRFQGRQTRMRVTGSEATDWRVGNMRVEVKQGGKR